MNKYKENSSLQTCKAFVLSLLSDRPLSTAEILKEVNNYQLEPFLISFTQLRKKGEIDMIGFFPCEITGLETPFYLSFNNSQITEFLTNRPRYDQRPKN